MYCGIDKVTGKVQFWAEGNIPSDLEEDEEVFYRELNQEEEEFLNSLSPIDQPYFNEINGWTKKSPKTSEQLTEDVEDMILLLAEMLGTEDTEESDE